ncbi:TlpA family protein disulfide reductase [Marinicella meishanensis]|uniref:TlpA family protein disulfide reductase n=1 Tax=Marinicella meishanensis TaxID=2873263 RepID=UPI001CC13C4A|nr:TlpA disulfide reductase family protein [Marinicella sp. NBU2979]
MKSCLFALLTVLSGPTWSAENTAWSLADASGKVHHFPTDAMANQQVTVLFFWATWCPYCQELMPHIQSALHQYESPLNLKVLALNVHEDADPQAYLNSKGHTFTLMPEAEQVADLYQMHGTPGVLIFDAKGQLVFDLRNVQADHLVRKNAGHGAKSMRKAPYWAALIRQALQQLVDGA